MLAAFPRLFSTRKILLCMLAGAAIGLAVGLKVLEPTFITGSDGKWVRPENDYNAYLVAWHYFVIDEWRLPLFALPLMGYPEGGSVLFNDALPIASLVTKLLYQLTGVRVNPFGWWILLTYILQGAMAARLAYAVGATSVWAAVAAAVLAVVNVSFVNRMGHTALSSHFLLLWAMALYFETVRRARPKAAETTALLAVALLVNAYLFVMALAIVLLAWIALGLRRQWTTRSIASFAAGMAILAGIGLVAGYGVMFVDPATMKSEGFGHYSWNLVTLFVPFKGLFGFMEGIARDATKGQYEGEAYVGHGVLLALALCLLFTPRKVLAHIRNHWVYVAGILAIASFAASNKVYFGASLLIQYDLPQAAIELANYFRASGRFIWPLAYSLAILPTACLFRWWPRAPAIGAALLAAFLQIQESYPLLQYLRMRTGVAAADLVDTPRLNSWLGAHERLWQYPSWSCGGLGGKRWAGNPEANRELQVQLAAARAGVPTNSVYTSRMLKDCPAEFQWGQRPELAEGVLYLLGPEAVAGTPALSALARSNACVTLDWAVACSLQWSRIAAEGGLGSRTIRK